MSTWTCKALLPLLGLALSACADGVAVSRSAPEAVSVAGNSVVVAGPPGYCVDRSVSGDRAGGAFVLLGSCASIARDATKPHPAQPGVLTVTVAEVAIGDPADRPLLEALAAYFRTETGRAALSRDGRAQSVEVLETRIEDGALYLHARDASGRERGMADEYWRALLSVNGRLVTLSVNAFSKSPLSARAGRRTLSSFAARIRAANAGARPS